MTAIAEQTSGPPGPTVLSRATGGTIAPIPEQEPTVFALTAWGGRIHAVAEQGAAQK
jgi:hypothetical protein